MKIRRILALFISICSSVGLPAQEFERWHVPVSKSEAPLPFALAGGMNAPQFSTIYLDQDSLADLFVFDRSGGVPILFVQDTLQPTGWTFAPEYATSFPIMEEWALLRDFNGDSIPDIFTYSRSGVPGIDVYRGNRGTDGGYTFEPMVFDNSVGVLGYPSSTGDITNIYVASIDIPDINDFDGDGDLDILSFQADGSRIHYYQNIALEQGMGLDTLIYLLEDRCWGKMVESFNTNDVILSPDPDICPSALQNARLHSGSTMVTFDPDYDGDRDLLLGDFSYESLLFLRNGGTASKAHIVAQTQNFPDYDVPVAIPFFPAAYIQDINQDGIEDLIAAPNQPDTRENTNMIWSYHGSMEDGALRFSQQSASFLIDGMIDLGTDAAPLLIDVNGDQLEDLVVGSRFHQDYLPDHPSQLFLLLNTGSSEAPAFDLMEDNWLNVPGLMEEADMLYPTRADIDGDGDQDLIVGNKRGKLLFVENAGIADGPFEAGTTIYPWFDIDVGFSSAPAFADVNGDGLLDLLVGEERGNVNLFANIGTTSSPIYDPQEDASGNDPNFGQIDARQNLAVFGLASPSVFQQSDSLMLAVGTTVGNILFYHLDGSYVPGTQLPVLSYPNFIFREGERTKITAGDLDLNGYQDFVMGNSRGGLGLFRTYFRTDFMVSTHNNSEGKVLFKIFPNPAAHVLNVQTDEPGFRRIAIRNVLGQVALSWEGYEQHTLLDVHSLMPGVYYIDLEIQGQHSVQSWIKF